VREVAGMTRSKKLKLYVWERVLCDYTCGMVVVLAHDLAEAREVWRRRCVREKNEHLISTCSIVPTHITSVPGAFWVYGGG